MRVIAGEAGGRRLHAPRGWATRPATARVRASIFSRLEARGAIIGARVLDLFAGSGSLGLEALSRGAASVVFVDSARGAIAAIERNLRDLGLETRAHLLIHDWTRAVAELARAGEAFDLVFVDPPFPRDSSSAVLAKLVQLDLLNLGGIVIARQFHRAPTLDGAGLECLNCATLGDHRIAFYRRAAAAVITDGTTGHGE